jgi:Na+-driven multidrug efflux pump
MFPAQLGIAGAALATAFSQIVMMVTYIVIMLKRELLRLSKLFRAPSKKIRSTLANSFGALFVRNLAFNWAFLTITKATQGLDAATGVAAAAHSICVQFWFLGGTVLLALGTVSNMLASAELGKKQSSPESVRALSKRLLTWGWLLGGGLGILQVLGLPLLKYMSPLPEVRQAAVIPSVIGALLQPLNGVVFVGEGLMIAVGAYRWLAAGTMATVAALVLALQQASSLTHVWACFWLFGVGRFLTFASFWFKPLLQAGQPLAWARNKSAPA